MSNFKKEFKWNTVSQPISFWDPSPGEPQDKDRTVLMSDAELIKNPGHAKFQDVLEASCRVLSELIELEEQKNSKSITEIVRDLCKGIP